MAKRRRKTPKKRNSTGSREASNVPKATSAGDTARSVGRSTKTAWTKRWKRAIEVISLLADVATIVAIVLTGYQIIVGNWQFDRSGPDYSWFMLDGIAPNPAIGKDGISIQTTFPMVMANSGRTEDTVISLSRDTKDAENMTICIPEFNGKGEYKDGSAVLNDRGSLSLAPGEARMLFAVSPRTEVIPTDRADGVVEHRNASFELTDDLTVYSASGRTFEAKKVEPDQEVIDHYENLPGFERAKKACMTLVDGES